MGCLYAVNANQHWPDTLMYHIYVAYYVNLFEHLFQNQCNKLENVKSFKQSVIRL